MPFRIGRQDDNDLVIRDSRASRRHAWIVADGDGYAVEDLGSTHGTYVNGERVERRTLRTGDRVTFGFRDSYEIVFTAPDADLNRILGQMPAVSTVPIAGAEKLAKLRSVLEVARALQHALSTESVLDAVVDAALTVTGTERGFLLLRESGDLSIRVARSQSGLSLSKDDLHVPTRLINRALKDRRDLLTMNFDPLAEDGTRPDVSVAGLELRSVVCVPLIRVRTGDFQETVHAQLNDTLGLLYLDSRGATVDLSSGNRELLQTLALEASTILENARLLEEERAKQKLEEELRVARTIQQSLLPKRLPQTGWFRVTASSTPSREVGGDYYDVLRLREDCRAIMVADVCGKGVSSALLASLIQGALLRAAESPAQIEDMLGSMNRFLLERTEGEKYATLFYCVCYADGVVRWANAAHCAPLLVRAGGAIETLQASGMPVGMLETAVYGIETASFAAGDKLIVYSDGVTEARDEVGRFYELDRLLEVIRRPGLDGASLHEAILADLRSFTGGAPQADDVTLVVVEFRPE